jgi:hypothetical protein
MRASVFVDAAHSGEEMTMQKWLVGLCFASGLAALAPLACTSTAPDPYPDVAAFCTAKAKAECQIASTCSIDATTCENVRNGVCTTDANAAEASGTRSYNSGNVQACIDKINAVYPHQPIAAADLVGPGSIQDKCERVFAGKVDKNQACTSDYDCISGRICSPTVPGGTQLVCADVVMVAAGGFCSNPGSQCAAGTSCPAPPAGQAATCVTRGAMCSATAPCPTGSTCMAGTCVAGAGSTCASDADCGAAAAYCDINASPPVCAIGLFTVSLGAQDCKAYSTVQSAPVDAAVPVDAAPPVDAAAPVDAPPAG